MLLVNSSLNGCLSDCGPTPSCSFLPQPKGKQPHAKQQFHRFPIPSHLLRWSLFTDQPLIYHCKILLRLFLISPHSASSTSGPLRPRNWGADRKTPRLRFAAKPRSRSVTPKQPDLIADYEPLEKHSRNNRSCWKQAQQLPPETRWIPLYSRPRLLPSSTAPIQALFSILSTVLGRLGLPSMSICPRSSWSVTSPRARAPFSRPYRACTSLSTETHALALPLRLCSAEQVRQPSMAAFNGHTRYVQPEVFMTPFSGHTSSHEEHLCSQTAPDTPQTGNS